MLLILCALVALIGMMGFGAARVARTMTGRPGTEARATRADLSTEAQATGKEARATGDVAGGAWWVVGEAEGPPPAGSARLLYCSTFTSIAHKASWVAGEEQKIRRPVGRAQRPRPLNRGPPPRGRALLFDFHLSRPQGVGPLSQVGAWEFLRSDVHCYP